MEDKSLVHAQVRNEMIKYIIGTIMACIVGGFTFYFKATAEIEEHSKVQQEHKEAISEIRSDLKIKASKEDINSIKQDIHELQASNQRILELLIQKQK